MKKAVLRILSAIALILAFNSSAKAVAVFLTANDLGGGLFQYDFDVNNAGATVPLEGLLVEGGNSIFGLDPSSTIAAPAGWGFISPLPPFDDLLSYFSPTPATNIPIGGSLGGFTFQSTTDPGTLAEVDLILVGSDSSQTPYKITPEPATMKMVFLAAGVVILSCRFPSSTRYTSVSSHRGRLGRGKRSSCG